MPNSRQTRDYQPDSYLDFSPLEAQAQALQRGLYGTNSTEDSLGRLQDAMGQEREIMTQLQDLPQDQGPSLLERIGSGLSSMGSSAGNALLGMGQGLGNGFSSGLDAMTPSRDTLAGVGRYFQDANAIGTGRMPLYMQKEQHQLLMNQNQQLMNERRFALASKLQQLKDTKDQNDMETLMNAAKHPNAQAVLKQLSEDPNFGKAQQAGMLAKGMREEDYGAMDAYQELIPPQVLQRFQAGTLPYPEFKAWLEEARGATIANYKAAAKSSMLEKARNTPAEQRTPHQAQIVQEAKDAQDTEALKREKLKSETVENYSQAFKARKEAEQGGRNADRTNMNRLSLSLTGRNFEDLPAGGPAQQMVTNEYYKQYAQARQNVEMAKPVPPEKRSDVIQKDEFLKSGKLNRPPAGITQGDLSKGNYISMNDQQQDQAMKIEQAKENLTAMMDLVSKHIKAKTPLEAATQYARLNTQAFTGSNSDLAAYKSGSEAFSSVFARVFGGEVGVMTQGDIDRWKKTLPTFGDMQGVMEKKKDLFFKLYNVAVMKFRKKIAGEDPGLENDKLEGLLKQADKLGQPTRTNELPNELRKRRENLFK